ncbi:hypothetical protein QQX98_001966 [Neonectria punicea]|uniref:Mid2 domain-containing protein n=1 Tax=Neonectria punicea TaxID=979145 RepID=A0ABR1HKS1_9HYPO
MTYSSSGPSLAQAPDVDPSSDSSSSSSWTSSGSHSHSHSHSHSRSNLHARSSSAKRHAHLHRRDSRQVNYNANDDNQDAQPQDQDDDDNNRSFDTGTRLRHSHRRLQNRETQSALKLDIRQEDTTGYVTQVVQTVSVVQVVDSVGSPIEIQTHYGDPNTVVVDSASGSTISASNPEPSSSEAAPASNPASTNDVAQSSVDMTPLQASTPAAETTSSSVPLVPTTGTTSTGSVTDSISSLLLETFIATASSYSVALDSLQGSALTPVPTVESAYNGLINGTNTTPTIESTSTSSQTTLTKTSPTSTFESTTLTSSDVTSTTTSVSSMLKNILSTSSTASLTSSTSPFSSSSTTETATDLSTILSSTIYSVSTETWTSTQYDDGGSGGYGDGTAVDQSADPTITSTSGDSSEDSSGGALSTQQKQVIGGVVGSIAGVAFLAILFLLAFKYKKKHGNRSILGDNAAGTNAKGLIAGGNSGGGSGGAMTERTGPFAVAAALAGLTGKRNNQTPPPDPNAGGERGFYRVSGKKLPSVLQTGGDGYSDPRESVASSHTDYWRGSQAFNPSEGGSNRLALGSPMRPVSGVPIIRTGPARTAIKEENPFIDPTSPSRPRPDSDALGGSIGNGSIASQDGSYGSPSRFQERI